MTNNTTKTDDQKPVIFKKPASPFNNDPHNNRGGKGGKRGSAAASGSGHKMKSISVPKFKGGSGGDR
ncbi:MAG: hypothetical protein K0R25_1054 [Rickettsiaceae bacterium]|jgi:hypothetical protein|nr:hypothetical protein [Rickettsiaceae bacterium]